MKTPKPRARRQAKQTKARRPGRPSGDGSDQREHLLDAALEHYANHGVAAASLRGIAEAAGVTPAMVSYYFGGKAALLDAVIEERLLPVVGEIRSHLEAQGDDAGALVSGFVSGMHATIAHHPWLPRLWVREVLSEGGTLRELLVNRIAEQVPRRLAESFSRAQQAGGLNTDLDPRLLVVSLIGLTLFPLAAAPLWRQVFDSEDLDSTALERHTLALLARGLEADHAP
ncbi:TetR family transcriptional regulator [Litchfieldella qijiaojingensis]|uniref:TetR family transcriptional regulator n=1 Tax=Litchfieldella qijiaojingensis TaxID=980347 RepID=A0ABQ2Z7V3_9GAMM|nr:TetR/AcrR family transcriptional regulator [Halomonas qijiaojingensis]GGY07474.1 TetR family transcriptional regulator [Halomonas qijiaojingensis]